MTPRARRYSCMRSVDATISRSATSPILSAKIGKSPEMLVGHSDDCEPGRLRAPAPADAWRRRDRAGSGPAAARLRRRRATARHGGSALASGSMTASSGARSSRDAAAATSSPRLRRAPCRPPSRTSPSPSCGPGRAPAGAARSPGRARSRRCLSAWRRGCSAAGSAIDRPRPMKARRSVSASVARCEPELSSTKCASSMTGSSGERGRRRAKMTLLSAPISVSTNILEKAGCALSASARRQRQLGKGGDLDVAVGVAVVPDGDAPALAVALPIRRCTRPRSGSRRRS